MIASQLQINNPVIGKVNCRSSCPGASSENITWCANIAYANKTIETCVKQGSTPGRVEVVSSTCEAQLIGLENSLRLPSVSSLVLIFCTRL